MIDAIDSSFNFNFSNFDEQVLTEKMATNEQSPISSDFRRNTNVAQYFAETNELLNSSVNILTISSV